MARTWGGVAMIAGGSILATAREKVCFAVVGFGVAVAGCETTWHKPLGFTGIGVAAAGVLLATVWSDVPVMRNMTVVPKRGGGPSRRIVQVLVLGAGAGPSVPEPLSLRWRIASVLRASQHGRCHP